MQVQPIILAILLSVPVFAVFALAVALVWQRMEMIPILVRDKMVVLIKLIILAELAVAVAAGTAVPMEATIAMPFRPAEPVAPAMFMPPLPILEEL